MHNTKYLKRAFISILRFMLCKYNNVSKVSHQIKNSNYGDDCMRQGYEPEWERRQRRDSVGESHLVG